MADKHQTQEEPESADNAQLVDHIGTDLWRAFRTYEQAMFDRIAGNGFEDITLPDSDVLVHVGKKGIKLVEIARQRRVSKQSAHEQVHSLVKRGYLVLENDPQDRRARIVKHSKKGQALVTSLKQIKRDLHEEITSLIGPDQLSVLKAILAKIEKF